ncbi:hemolysin III family protein [soil metagenome]
MVCFFLSLPAGALVVATATSDRGRAGAFVYAFGLAAVFGVSGLYHRGRWSPVARARMKRLDHATIFVMIAGTYTPVCLVALNASGTVMLVAMWVGAALGLGMALSGIAERRVIGLVSYLLLSWAAAISLPELSARVSNQVLALILVGGVVYTAGVVVLATRWPNPVPRVFGYHEVWHVMVVAAVVCHFLAILSIVRLDA